MENNDNLRSSETQKNETVEKKTITRVNDTLAPNNIENVGAIKPVGSKHNKKIALE